MKHNTMHMVLAQADHVSMKAAAVMDRHHKPLLTMLILMAALYATAVVAGTTGSEFQGIYDQVKDWTSGYLGKAIALFSFLLGLGVGVARQSPIPAISGVVFALFVAFGPDIIEGIATAVI